jgi:hypothetical protein
MTATHALLTYSIHIVLHQNNQSNVATSTFVAPKSVVQAEFHLFEASITSYNLIIRLSGIKARSHFFV